MYVCARGRLRLLSLPLGGRLVREISVPDAWSIGADVVEGDRMILLHGPTDARPETISEPGLIVHDGGGAEGGGGYHFFKCLSKSGLFGEARKPLPPF